MKSALQKLAFFWIMVHEVNYENHSSFYFVLSTL